MAHAHKHFGAEKVVRGETPHASADMNVTPLIDVLLVLLIIFMATLPLTQRGMDINLPLETKTPTTPQDNTQVMQEAARWIEQNLDAERMFLTVESFDPHEPWFVPEHYRLHYDPDEGREQVISPYAEMPEQPTRIDAHTSALASVPTGAR